MEIVVCMDIGSAYTGYAFSSRKEYERDMLDIHLNEEWTSGHANLNTLKAPTIALLSPDKTLHSFGYEAERKFTHLLDEKKNDMWFYFKRFKTDLKTKPLRKDTVVSEEGGKSLNAVSLLSLILAHLKAHFLGAVESLHYGHPEKGFIIKYVILVPSRWDNTSRECMKVAAKKAGLQNTVLVTESEAVTRHCSLLPLRPVTQGPIYVLKPGSKHLVVNLAGCSLDTTVQEILTDGTIKEYHKNVGDSSGAVRVDLDFLKFLNMLFGNELIETYSKKQKQDFLDLQYEFELRKRQYSLEVAQGTRLELPLTLIKACTAKYKESLQFRIDDTDFVGKILALENSIILNKAVMKDIFGAAVKGVVGYMSNLSKDPEAKQADVMILVGGFSESAVIQGALKFYFPDSSLVFVAESDVSAMQGGVLLGHQPNPVTSLTSRFTCGIATAEPFVQGRHPEKKRFLAGGKALCTDIFQVHIPKQKHVQLGVYSSTHLLTINRSTQKQLALKVYASANGTPSYTTDRDCVFLGKFYLELPKNRVGHKIKVQMAIVGNCLLVCGKDENSELIADAAFSLVDRVHQGS